MVANHKLFAQMLAHAMACDQTRVINVTFSDAHLVAAQGGEPMTHHIHTHEEPIDAELGYQPSVT